MRRIAIIGNSHVGAIKEAVDAPDLVRIPEETRITFFASNQNSLESCRVVDGVVSSSDPKVKENLEWTSGGQSEIRLDGFDEIYIVARPSLHSLLEFFAGDVIPPISEALATEITRHRISEWYIRLGREIADAAPQVTVRHLGAPFVSAEAPLAKRILGHLDKPKSPLHRRADKVRAIVDMEISAISTENFGILRQPSETLEAHGVFTRPEFATGSKVFVKGRSGVHKKNEFEHMNARYGAAVLRDILGHDSAKPAG